MSTCVCLRMCACDCDTHIRTAFAFICTRTHIYMDTGRQIHILDIQDLMSELKQTSLSRICCISLFCLENSKSSFQPAFETSFVDMLLTLHLLHLLFFFTSFLYVYVVSFCGAGLGCGSGDGVFFVRTIFYSLATDLHTRNVCMTMFELFLYLLLTIT